MSKDHEEQIARRSADDTEKSDDAMNLREKMKITDVKSPSPTSLLARNAALLPSEVMRVKQLQNVPAASNVTSSGSATGNPRNKTALAPGHSLMDWIRLGNSGVDLTGVGGVPRVVSMSELASHCKRNDAWIAIRGIVFNVTRYMDFHPGGVDELMKGVGKDGTKLFENVHAWVNYQSILQKCVVGKLSRSCSSSEGQVTKASNCSSAALGLIKSCTKQSKEEDTCSESSLENLTMDWRQTSNSITLFYQSLRDYPGIDYQLTHAGNSKLTFAISFEKEILTHELELPADILWPPTWKRNFDTMEVDFTFLKKHKAIWKSQGNQTLSREPKTNRRTYRDFVVVSNTSLCKLVNLLVLKSKDFLELVPIGRHIEARMNVMGTEVSRPYTPVPPCLHPDEKAAGYEDDCICLMVKKYPDGALSPQITSLEPGNVVQLSNGLGAFVIESFDPYPVQHMIAGGTGLTAMLGIIQRSLARRTVRTINLINVNKDEDNIFYAKELKKVSKERKLKVTHVLSHAGESWQGKRGAVSYELLQELIGESSADGCVFTCGPRGFMQATKKCLEMLNWKPYQIHEFDD